MAEYRDFWCSLSTEKVPIPVIEQIYPSNFAPSIDPTSSGYFSYIYFYVTTKSVTTIFPLFYNSNLLAFQELNHTRHTLICFICP